MSTVVVPTPSSASVAKRGPRLTDHARSLLTAVNLHFAGVAVLAVICLYLAIHLGFLVQQLHANNADAVAQQYAQLRAAEIAALPLRGLDVKLVDSTAQADAFYAQRLPYAYSQVAAELGALTKRENVRLSRVQYAQTPALTGTGELIEVRMDASLAGDYRPLVQLINTLERDKMFFVINGITFTGASNGQVNLRMRITTYLRQPRPEEPMADTPQAEAAAEAGASAAAANVATPAGSTPPLRMPRRPGGAR